MTSTLDKKKSRELRQRVKTEFIALDLEETLTSFRAKIHKMLQEPVGGALAQYHPPVQKHNAGKRIKPFIVGEVLKPLEPIKLPKGVEKLVIEDIGEFKEPSGSKKMQDNLMVLELRLDSKGYLYSRKPFDTKWHWKSQAIWLRLTGMGYINISKRLKRSVNTVKSMFYRLNITRFFPPASELEWATIGYGAKNTLSGWKAILHGGGSGILYPSDEMIIDKKSGSINPLYVAKVTVGELIQIDKYPISFNLKKHSKEIKKRTKEETIRKIKISTEQKNIEIENLLKHVKEGFDPKTGTYSKKEVSDD